MGRITVLVIWCEFSYQDVPYEKISGENILGQNEWQQLPYSYVHSHAEWIIVSPAPAAAFFTRGALICLRKIRYPR